MSTIELPITGMTCASCANRIERRLNKLDGVTASVNYATEKASVEYDEAVDPQSLVAAVEAVGYQAVLPSTEPEIAAERDETEGLRRRAIVAALLSVPALLLAMIPALQFDNLQWLSLQLVTPVVLWAAWPFHKAAWAEPQARRGDDGHARLPRHAGGVAVVAVRAVLRRRGHE